MYVTRKSLYHQLVSLPLVTMVVAKNTQKTSGRNFLITQIKIIKHSIQESSSRWWSTPSSTPNTDRWSLDYYVTNNVKLKIDINWFLKCVLVIVIDHVMELMKFLWECFQTVSLTKINVSCNLWYCTLLQVVAAITNCKIRCHGFFIWCLNSITQSYKIDVILHYLNDEDNKVKVRYFMLKLEIKEDLFGCLFFCFGQSKCPDQKKAIWTIRYFFTCLVYLKMIKKEIEIVSPHKSGIANLYYTVCELVIYLQR